MRGRPHPKAADRRPARRASPLAGEIRLNDNGGLPGGRSASARGARRAPQPGAIRDDRCPNQRRSSNVKIAVVGTGYVGLVQGTCLAESGNDVVCVDKIAAKIQGLKQGKVPIYEPGLGELVHRNLRDGRLSFTTDLAAGIRSEEHTSELQSLRHLV